jgi:isopenicillin N synthase-like dioxygenase
LNNNSGHDRFSVPFFFNPSLSAEIPDFIPGIAKEVLDQRPLRVVSDVKKEQLLQSRIYGENAFAGLKRSHNMVYAKWYGEEN